MAKQTHLQAILSAVDRISPVLRKVGLQAGMMRKAFADVGSSSRNLLGGLGLPATVGLGAIGYGLLSAARNALTYAGALQDAKDVTSMSGRAIQEYGTVFEAAGIAQEEFLAITSKLNQGLANAAAGKDKSLAALLTKLRIPIRNLRGEIRSVDEVLPELADAFAKNTNPALRTRMAVELFGKSGARLIAVLMKGGKSLVEARQEVQRLGAVLSDTDTERLDDLGDAFGVLGRQVKVQTSAAFAIAAPAILAATKSLQDWIANNKELLQQKLGAYIERVATAFQGWIESGGLERLADGIGNVVDGISSFVNAVGGMRNVLIGLGVLVLAGPVSSLFALIASLTRLTVMAAGPALIAFKALVSGMGTVFAVLKAGQVVVFGMSVSLGSLALAALPVIAAIAAVAAAAYLIYSNWDKVGPFLRGIWDGIVATVTAGVAKVTELLQLLNPMRIIRGLGEIGGRLGGMLADATLGDPMAAAGAGGGQLSGPGPLLRAGALQSTPARKQGDLRVRFDNAPAGMRVESGTVSPGLNMNVDVGRRSTGSIG